MTELHKGYFPHLFNKIENQAYEGVMPDVSFYDPKGMSPKKRDDFLRWHANKVANNYHFNLVEEMKAYCASDVKLLKAGCRTFIAEFKQQADFDPIEKCITIASACNRYWRKKWLQPNTIAIEPPRGWKGCQTLQSFQACQWLAWKNEELGAHSVGANADRIRHAYNGGEYRIAGYLVDGFDITTNTVYEFNGCFFHGCRFCFPDNRHSCSKKRPELSFHDAYVATKKKEEKIQVAGYHLVTMWECGWKKLTQNVPAIQAFLKNKQFTTPLNPRDAFFGGRTNAVQQHHHVEEGEKIHYQDVTSLYPWVNKYQVYLTDHPPILTAGLENANISDYFGIAKVTILPPYELFHPVLPLRQGGKLTFPLCRTCVETEMGKTLLKRSFVCKHSVEERQLTGTWCTPELMEAISQGYIVRKIHEIWHFPDSQQRAGLFKDYVNTWLKIKTESSGYPAWATTDQQKRLYVANYTVREGIDLDPDLITKNPGRKATAKLMLNSF